MDIDLILDARARDTELAEQGALAEKLGFAGVWVSSLLDGRDPFANLSLLAKSTRRIALGPIAVNPWDTHPVKISGALHTLNEMSNGRARIVIGGGGEALASLGLKPERRVRAVQECVEIIRGASRGERFDYEGELYQARGYQLGWLQATPPRVYVGANRPQMLRMAGRVSHGVMFSDLPVEWVASARDEAITAGATRDDALPPWFGNFMAWHVYDQADEARREAKRWLLLRGLFRPWVLERFLEQADVDLVMRSQPAFAKAFATGSQEIEGIPSALADKLVDELTLTAATDDIDRLVRHLAAFRDAGLSSVCLRLYQQPDASMRLIAERVMPELR